MVHDNKQVAQVVVGLPVEGPFDYAVPAPLRAAVTIGSRVSVMFSRRKITGYIIGFGASSEFKGTLNPILALLDDGNPALDDRALKLTQTFSQYYGCSWGEAIEAYLPDALRRGSVDRSDPIPAPTAVSKNESAQVLIHDPIGNKRWTELNRLIAVAVAAQRGVIFLVPESVQIEFVLSKIRGMTATTSSGKLILNEDIAVLDKSITGKKETALWQEIRRGKYKIVLGTRSAVFAPLPSCGLIVVYDEENLAYKQEQTPHYRVHEIASMRRGIEACSLVFVSSLPTAEIWHRADVEKWTVLSWKDKFVAQVQLIDMANYNPRKMSILSYPLQSKMQKVLESRGKVILFMNRRGFSTMTRCNECGHTLQCERCNVNLIYLYSKRMMVCRRCGFERDLPKNCPSCKGAYLRSTGRGVEKLESELHQYFPQASIGHYDGDSTEFPVKADIVISTQALFRHVETVRAELTAVLNADAELNRFDFRSAQHTLATMVQLKQMTKESMVIQTRVLDDYTLRAVQSDDWVGFYRQELEHRKELGLPPFRH